MSEVPATTAQLLNILGMLALVLLLIAALALLARRFLPGAVGSGRRMRLLEVLPVSRHEKLMLVKVGGKTLLLGSGNQGIRKLESWEQWPESDGQTTPVGEAEGKDFQSILSRLLPAVMPVLLAGLMLMPETSFAQDVPLLNVVNDGASQSYSAPLQIMLLLSALSFLPAMLLVLTSFTRIIVVFSLLRQSLGLQQTPPNQVLIGLALFLTAFIMTPVYEQIDEVAIQPWMKEQINFRQAAERASVPLKGFMLRQTRESDLRRMADISGITIPSADAEIPFRLLAPAYIISELKTAFQIGFLLFIPFLVIDLVVASVLMAMGMMMLSPLVISLPFKLMLFVMVDGWSMITGTLAASFW